MRRARGPRAPGQLRRRWTRRGARHPDRGVGLRGAVVFFAALAAVFSTAFAALVAAVLANFVVASAALPTARPVRRAALTTGALPRVGVLSSTGAAMAAIRKDTIAFSANALRLYGGLVASVRPWLVNVQRYCAPSAVTSNFAATHTPSNRACYG